MQLTRFTFIKLTSALLVTFTALLFTLTVKAQYFEQSGALSYAQNRPNRQVFDISPDSKIAVALKNDPTSVHPAMLTTFDPILGTQFDSKIFGFGPLHVRLAKVGTNLRAVVQTSEGGPRKIFLFDVSATGQLTEIASTQLTTSGADNGSNLMLSEDAAVGFVIVATDGGGGDVVSFSLNTGAIIKRLPISSAPDTIALYESQTKRLLVFRIGNQLKVLDVLDPANPVETASVTLVSNNEFSGFADNGIVFSTDGRYIFFANQFFNFAAIDLNTKQIVGTIPGANFRFRFVESFETPQQRLLAVASLPSGTVNTNELLIVDATDPSQMTILNSASPSPGQYFKFSKDGSRLFTANDTGLKAINLPNLATAWERPAPSSASIVHQLQLFGNRDEIMGAWSVSGTLTSLFGSFPTVPPNISLSDSASVNEGAGTARFTVSLSAPTTHRFTILHTFSGTAQLGSDFNDGTPNLVIEPGATSGTIDIPIVDDTLDEDDETLDLTITSNVGVITRAQSTVTIVDNDAPPSASIADASVAEGSFFANSLIAQVTLSAASGKTVSLSYSTVANTASTTDFTVNSGTVTFTPGQTLANITIPITPDRLSEDDETLSIVLSNPSNVTIAQTTATGTILNDDAPILAVAAPSQRAIALDNVLLTMEPFAVNNPDAWLPDKRTRINIFSLNMILTPGLVVTAQGVDSQQVVHQLPVEFVGSVPGFNPVVPQEPSLTQIVIRLPDSITLTGDLQVRITARGRNSNQVLIAVKP